jgi:predicted secreted protein
MTIVNGIVLYVIIWWVVIFAVLPWGIRPADSGDPSAEFGAPKNPVIWKRALWTSLVAAVIWLILFWIIEANLFSFRAWVSGGAP